MTTTPRLGMVATWVASSARERDLGWGRQAACASGNAASMRRVEAASAARSGKGMRVTRELPQVEVASASLRKLKRSGPVWQVMPGCDLAVMEGAAGP